MKRFLILSALLMMTVGTAGCRGQCGDRGLLPRFDWLRGSGTAHEVCNACETGPVYSGGYVGEYDGMIMAPSAPLMPGPVQTLPNP